MANVAYPSLKAALRALRKQEISSVDLVGQALERIEALNPRLRALSDVIAERARAERSRATAVVRPGGLWVRWLGYPWSSRISSIQHRQFVPQACRS